MIIDDKLEVILSFDGYDYPIATGNLSIFISETATEALPLVTITIADNDAMKGAPSITDGMLMEVTVGDPRTGYSFTIPFRQFTYSMQGGEPSQDMDAIHISGYTNCPDIFKVSKFEAIEGKSGDIAKKIAETSNLIPEVDPTVDSQVWIRSGTTAGSFLKQVMAHAYKDDYSAFVATVTRHGALRFFNLTDRKKERSKYSFVQRPEVDADQESKQVYFENAHYSVKSGFMNIWRGYGFYATEFSVITGKKESVYADKASKSVDHLSVNSELAQATRSIAAPVNCGNTHKNYFKAEIQNSRNLSLYSTELTITTTVLKPIDVLDRVTVTFLDDRQDTFRQPMSGDYFVSKISMEISDNTFRVNYNLVREGFNSSDANTGQKLI